MPEIDRSRKRKRVKSTKGRSPEKGQRFGKRVVVSPLWYYEDDPRKVHRVSLKCDCCSPVHCVAWQGLLARGSQSCGCEVKTATGNRFRSHGMRNTKLYNSWRGMKERCTNPNYYKSEHYFDKGITLCEEWHKFAPFAEWALANGYEEGLTVDRVDPSGNYCPENCRWVSMSVQMHNRGKRKGSSSKYLGVSFTKRVKKWRAVIKTPGASKHTYLGEYATEEKAARVYDKAALEIYGPTANINFPDDPH